MWDAFGLPGWLVRSRWRWFTAFIFERDLAAGYRLPIVRGGGVVRRLFCRRSDPRWKSGRWRSVT